MKDETMDTLDPSVDTNVKVLITGTVVTEGTEGTEGPEATGLLGGLGLVPPLSGI
jgi:hypothetical protein